ncbi:MAG: aldehyde dehydrogenase family protein [Bacteroidetes bacterium]|nr:aldehyde dehydrogenase family protein [Bacteroidota bacterium]MBU1720626.1 aldehyde dehydrogenase family protein [Bacteroidota bacterium]
MERRIFKIYCGGQFIETSEKLEIHCSYTGGRVGITYLAGKKELETAIKRAQDVQVKMKDLPAYQKFKILREISDELIRERYNLAQLIAQEASKPLSSALGEVDRAAQTFLVAAEEAKRLPAEMMSADWTQAGEGKEAIVKYFPVGIVAGISPFNFPLNLTAHKIAPAIAAGCPIILKPASFTPLSTLELARIIDNTDLPGGAVSVLPMNRQTGNLLVTDPRISLLTFTGSAEVGWKMKEQAGRKRVVLELGGNAGVIISATANLPVAAAKCAVGGFAYSGQVCIHTQRIYVEETVFEEFCDLFLDHVRKLRAGDPMDDMTQVSSLIDNDNAIRVKTWIDEAVKAGASVLIGGKRNGTFVEPTVITGTNAKMKVNSCEVFGPVVVLEPYTSFENAVAEINNTEFGLQAGVFTNQISEMNHAFRHIEAGGVIINDVPTFRVDHTPYGGIKNSGFGREGVKYSMMDMLEPKLLIKNTL